MRFDEFINGVKQPIKPQQFTDMERAIMEGGGSLNDIKPVAKSISALRQVVDEARTNPDQNPKPESGFKELAAVATTITDPENWAISMTAEPKLGINPQVGISEDTPKGIYFYPLNYALDKTRYGKLPWGHDYPYIQLFQYDRSGEMTKQTQVDPAKLKQALLQYCPEEVIQSAIDDPEYDGTPYWFIYDCLSRLGKNDETNVVRWNKVLRDLGFTSVFDNGAGWIAHNEPTQGVVLDPRVIKQHKTIVNKQKSRLVTPAVIEQAIFETMDMELAANRAWQAYDPDGSKLRAAAKEYAKKPEFKQYYGKPGTEEIFDKAEGMGRYAARQLSDIAYEWYQAQRATKESVQVNHEIEVFEDYDTIDQTLRNAGYEELGAGADATVWTKDVGTVIKIIVPEEEDALNTAAETFKKFYEFCMKHQDIECLPKFIPIQGRHYTEFTIKEKTFIQISMERLYPLKNNSFEEAMVWYLSDFATKNTPWPKVKEFLGTPKAWQDTDFSSVANQLALKVSSLKGVKEAKYSLLYTVMTLLYHTGRINKLGWDLHTENAMQRRDGTIVIIDPWFNHEKD